LLAVGTAALGCRAEPSSAEHREGHGFSRAEKAQSSTHAPMRRFLPRFEVCRSEEHRDEKSAVMPAYDEIDVRHKRRMLPRISIPTPKAVIPSAAVPQAERGI